MRIFKITLIFMLLAVLVACGGEDTYEPYEPETRTQTNSNDDDRRNDNSDDDSCLADSCPAEVSACGFDCQNLLGCLSGCSTDACQDRCISQSSNSGIQQLSELLDCYNAECQ